MNQKVLSISLIIFFFGCKMVSDDDSSNIAKYGDSYLSKEDFSFLMSGVNLKMIQCQEPIILLMSGLLKKYLMKEQS